MTVSTVKRSQFRTLLNTGTAESPTWSVVGDGITSAKISYNPKTTDQVFIHEDTGSTEVESYSPNMPIEAIAKRGDAVFDYVDQMRIDEATLEDARAEIVNVWLYLDETLGEYPAEKRAVSVQVEDFGGDGGEAAKLNYQLNYVGTKVKGTFNPTSGDFTPNP